MTDPVRSSKLKVAAALALVFVLGAVTGGAVWHAIYARRVVDMFDSAQRGSRHGVFVWSLERKLDLSSEQKEQIEAILARYDKDVAEVATAPDPRVAALKEKMRADIRSTLTEEQKPRFDELIKNLDAVKARSAGGGPASSGTTPAASVAPPP